MIQKDSVYVFTNRKYVVLSPPFFHALLPMFKLESPTKNMRLKGEAPQLLGQNQIIQPKVEWLQ